MMQANISGILKPESICLHHDFLKFLKIYRVRAVWTWFVEKFWKLRNYVASQYLLASGSQDIGLHHKFLQFLRLLPKPRSLQPLPGKS